jgi:hypothetical protein
MITTVYFENSEGHKVVVGAFLMIYDAKAFIEADKSFKKLEMQELTLDAWKGWQVIIEQTNKAEGKGELLEVGWGSIIKAMSDKAEGKNDE